MEKIIKKTLETAIEIFLLVCMSFSFSYIVHEGDSVFNEAVKEYEELKSKQPDFFKTLGKSLLNKLSKPVFSVVSAEQNFQCCELTKNNAICQNIVFADDCADNARLAPSKCDATSYCREGCCIDDNAGTYDKKSTQSKCLSSGGRWIDDVNCNIPEAQLGCCMLNSRNLFITQQQCQIRVNQGEAPELDWRQMQCAGLSETRAEGACKLAGSMCRFTTEQNCISLAGEFYLNKLCTSPEVNSSCVKTSKTMCVNGKDEVYFQDSCGNPGNIYDALKINNNNYWDSISTEICGTSNGNANSKTCGNCNRFLGGMCASSSQNKFSAEYGDFYCKDTSCQYKGEKYKNGESWCVYDGKIGEGDDIVGSRHWKYVCNQGEIQIEPCADYRNQICIQQNTFDINGTKVEFRNANCIANNYRECLDLNSKKDGLSKCSATLNCIIQNVKVGGSFDFSICVPKYPGGIDLFSEGEQTMAEKICGMNTRTCVIAYKQTMTGACKCVDNCECDKASFTEQMNDVCRKLGDCGLEVNIAGEYTSNYKISKAPSLSSSYINKLVAMSVPVPGLYAEVEDYSKYLEAAGLIINSSGGGGGGGDGNSNYAQTAGSVLSGAGGVALAASMIPGVSSSFASFGIGLAPFAGAMIAAGIGMLAGSMIAKAMGLSPIGSMLMAVGAGMVFLPVMFNCPIFLIIGIVLIIISLFFGGSKCKPKKVTFTCQPWQPPTGGSDCEKCNEDLLKPCSEYRCQSLGAACELLNKGTGQEKCADANPNDATPPQIEPQYGIIGQGTQYSDINSRGFKITSVSGGCLNAYEDLVFGITTNEFAQCNFDLSEKNFDEMEYSFGANAYLKNHTTSFFLPDPSHGISQGLEWSGNLSLYVKCRDTHGNMIPEFYKINMCVNQGEDKTAPRINALNPANNKLISFNATSQEVFIYTNEVAKCKWDLQDKDYLSMENQMLCESDIDNRKGLGYECNTTLSTPEIINEFYIRCRDQPWLIGENETKRNSNQQSFIYTLNKPEKQLTIDWIMPNQDIEINTAFKTINLKAQTSGGGEYVTCAYSLSGFNTMIDMFTTTFSNPHEQSLNLIPGEKIIYIECRDETGDRATGETRFNINYDESPPQLARVYSQGEAIKLITTEESECRYSEKSCSINFNNMTLIGNGKEHEINSELGKTHYVKCKDEFGNIPVGCSVIVKAI